MLWPRLRDQRPGAGGLWQNGQLTDPGGGLALAINAREQVVGLSSTDGATHPVLWETK
jgi:hypothetical protein